jgi:MFS family permease
LVSGIGPELWVVVVGRAIQGVGAAFITPSAIGLLLEITPAARRTRALAWTGGVSSIGVATGPTLGALVVDPPRVALVVLDRAAVRVAQLCGRTQRAAPNASA